jgi:hypothetical protein
MGIKARDREATCWLNDRFGEHEDGWNENE